MKILYITTIGNTMHFFKDIVGELVKEGHTVDVAANENGGETPVDDYYKRLGCKVFCISCSRSPFHKGNIKAAVQIRKIAAENHYDIVHCHTPIASVCTRIACRGLQKSGKLKVIYTAHGFHFYSGAPMKNWLIYYPVEYLCSYWTDTLITINREDYERAKKRFHAARTVYVPGVGIDTGKFGKGIAADKTAELSGRRKIREDFGIPGDAALLLSIGELNENKNHEVVIRALKDLDVYYLITGSGDKKEYLENLAAELNLEKRVRFAGYRLDVADFYDAADIYVLPSKREGLNVSIMEAMASGLPVVCSRIRGNTELIDENGGGLFDPYSPEDTAKEIGRLINGNLESYGAYNLDKIRRFDVSAVNKAVESLYRGGYNAAASDSSSADDCQKHIPKFFGHTDRRHSDDIRWRNK